MKFSRVSRDFFSLVLAVDRPLVNQLTYPYRPQIYGTFTLLNTLRHIS